MDQFLHFAGDYWWLIFPVGGWANHVARYNEKRRRDKIELARIKPTAKAEELRSTRADKAQVTKVLKRHDEINEKWFAYELDLATLI